jgi:hypothetical protein
MGSAVRGEVDDNCFGQPGNLEPFHQPLEILIQVSEAA